MFKKSLLHGGSRSRYYQLILTAIGIILFQSVCFSQKIISGTVKDNAGNAIENVSITETGNPGNGTVSRPDGSYSLSVPNGSMLSFSAIGYESKELPVPPDDDVLNVSLSVVANSLNEVVVIGYATQKKGNIAAAVSTINAEDLARTTSTTTAGALVGKAAGITYRQASGVPGSAANIQIRSMGTPLYVIDGVMSDGGTFNNINVNDIESISILKDGAAAIYGIKAANGVILVTTKGGKFGSKPTVSLDAYYGWQQWFRYPRFLTPYEWQYANLMKDVNNGVYTGTPEEDQKMLELWRQGFYDPETGRDYRGFDWKKEYVNNAAPLFYRNLSVNGGSEKVAYYLSFGAVNQDAVFDDYKFKRYNITSRVDAKVSNRLKLGVKLMGRMENRSNPGMPGSDDYEAARVNLFELPPVYRPYANDNSQYLNAVPSRFGQNMAAITNDIAGTYTNDWYVLQTDWTGELKLIKGLNLKGLYSLNFKNNVVDNFEKGWREYTYNKNTDSYIVAYDKTAAGNTYNFKARGTGIDQLTQLTLNYDSIINRDHHFSGVVGIESLRNDYKGLNVQQNPINSDLIQLLNTDPKNTVGDSKTTFTRLSYIFRLGYEYRQKYIVSALGRYDGSWKFPEDKRWGFFPSVQVAWNIAREGFVTNSALSGFLSNAKIRFSYGELGDDNLGYYPDFAYLPGYNYNTASTLIAPFPGTAVTGQKIPGISYKGLPVTTLSWMTSKMTNIGIDLGFFNNRLTFEANAFKRSRSGIPVIPNSTLIPVETGLTVLPQNLDADQTVGLDGSLIWTDYSRDFKYTVGLNATLARQKFGARYGEKFFNSWDQYRYGQKDRWSNVFGSSEMWMWEVIGVFKTQNEIDRYPVDIDGSNNANTKPGDLIFKDQNGDGIINDYDLRPLGYAGASWPWDDAYGNKLPLLTGGLNLGFQYKGIDFAVDFAGGFMNTFVMDWLLKWGTDRSHNGYYFNNIDVWRHEDILDPQSPWVAGTFPSVGTASTRWWNTFYVYNVNYVRLRNLMLGYTLPGSFTRKGHISRARIYAQGTNLFSIDNLSKLGFDPEITRADGKDYPQHRVITIGLQLTF